MAWLDDRIWCHPKMVGLSDKAFVAYVKALTYSSGMGTQGHLTPGQQRLIGGATRQRNELIDAGLWELNGDGQSILIHDWAEHNSKRDARREADRERKKQERLADPDGWIMRTAAWKKTRQEVFDRDGGVCLDCGEIKDSWHADHVPDRKTLLAQGGDPFDVNGIVTRCPSCHSRKHALERHHRAKLPTEPSDT